MRTPGLAEGKGLAHGHTASQWRSLAGPTPESNLLTAGLHCPSWKTTLWKVWTTWGGWVEIKKKALLQSEWLAQQQCHEVRRPGLGALEYGQSETMDRTRKLNQCGGTKEIHIIPGASWR